MLDGLFIEFFLPFCSRLEKSVQLASRWLLGKQREPSGGMLALNARKGNCILGYQPITMELLRKQGRVLQSANLKNRPSFRLGWACWWSKSDIW